MNARVKEDCRYNSIQFQGNEYVKQEWRRIPVNSEVIANENPYLELEKPAEAQEPLPEDQPDKPQTGKARAQGKARGAK